MKSRIVTIFPSPSERYVAARPAITGSSSAPTGEGPRLVKGTLETLPSIESVILQRLLAELENRQISRAQPTYIIEPSRPAHRAAMHHVVWGATWLLSIAIAALAVNYFDKQTMVARTGDHESRSIEELTASLSRQTDAFSSLSNSLQQLAIVIESSANRTAMVRETPQPHADVSRRDQAAVSNQSPSIPEPAVPVIIGNSASKADSSPIPMGGHIHPPMDWAVAPANATVHHNSMGVMDYWFMPRIVAGTAVMTKVVPFLQNNSGIFVHHVAEARDYLVTTSGDWIELPDGKEKK